MTRLTAALALAMALSIGCSEDAPVDGAPDGGAASPDAGSDVPSDCDFDPSVRWDLLAETLQLRSAGGDTCVAIERRNDCPPDWICKAVPFTVLEARIGHGGNVAIQTEPAAMTWHETHHNWSDAADIEVDGVQYRLEFTFGEPGAYTLSAADDGAALWGPVELLPVNP